MKKEKGQVSEEKQVAANYVIGFYNLVVQLTHSYAVYENLLIELDNRYTDKDASKMEESENTALRESCQTVRYYAIRAYISYSSIMHNIGKPVDNELKSLHELMKKDFVIPRDKVEAFAVKLNAVLLESVMKKLLESSQDIVNQLYGAAAEGEDAAEGA